MGTPVPLRGFTGKGPIEALRTRTPLGEGDLESYEGSLYAQLLGGGGGGHAFWERSTQNKAVQWVRLQ